MTNTWWDYVQRVSGGATQTEIARRTKLTPASVSRWQSSAPKPSNANRFAVVYGRPVIEAFIAAGYMTDEQAGAITDRTGHGLADVTTADMLEELTRRLPAGTDGPVVTTPQPTATVPKRSQPAGTRRSTTDPSGPAQP